LLILSSLNRPQNWAVFLYLTYASKLNSKILQPDWVVCCLIIPSDLYPICIPLAQQPILRLTEVAASADRERLGRKILGRPVDALIHYWVVLYLKESYPWSLQFIVPTMRDKFIEIVLISYFQSYPESVLAKFKGNRQAEPSPHINDWFSDKIPHLLIFFMI
jgi:hypothetical protein